MASESIENFSLVKGDSSDIWYYKASPISDLSNGWTGKFVILDAVGGNVISSGGLPLILALMDLLQIHNLYFKFHQIFQLL